MWFELSFGFEPVYTVHYIKVKKYKLEDESSSVIVKQMERPLGNVLEIGADFGMLGLILASSRSCKKISYDRNYKYNAKLVH